MRNKISLFRSNSGTLVNRLNRRFLDAVYLMVVAAIIFGCSKEAAKDVAPVIDTTAPSVLSVVPVANMTSFSTNGPVSVAFNELMNTSTISTLTFTLKQGTTAVAGLVTYAGTTATFTPAGPLAANTVYTATISTGVKDAAGNALAESKIWSFTTGAVAAGLSFANDVVPVLGMCNSCHTHGWTTSAVASTFYANLVSKSYVNAAAYTSAKIYTKINGGHPGSSKISTANTDKIINWMKEGSKNN